MLEVLCQGLSNKLIARKLDMAENTVWVHVAAILAHLHVTSRTEAIIKAQQLGMVR